MHSITGNMRISLALLLPFFPALVLAAPDEPQAQYSRKCSPTPSVNTNKIYPGQEKIVSSNNLALPTGKAVYAKGERVYISGHVLDRNCVPISDAIIEIWQTSPEGKTINPSLSDRLDPYPDFVGSGRAVSDNLGKFTFITLFPAPESQGSAPRIHFRIVHDGFPAINTDMFFAGDKRNDTDSVLDKLHPESRHQLSGTVSQSGITEDAISVKWDIVMDGVNSFRKY